MINTKDDNGVSYYAKWTDVCDQHQLEKKFWIKGDKEYFSIIKEQCNDGIVKWFANDEGCIAFPKKQLLSWTYYRIYYRIPTNQCN